MIIEITKKFDKDISKIKDKKLLERVFELVNEIEETDDISTISHLKKMVGYKTYYRVRVSDYRIGLDIKDGVVILLRCLQRKEIYRRFP